jgi:hypothetical protein
MNVDCDGANNSAGKCSNDPSGQSQTAFQDTLQSYGISDLDASIHSYVVFGNDGGSPTFDPSTAGMKPLSVMAVVCGDNMVRLQPFVHHSEQSITILAFLLVGSVTAYLLPDESC